MTKQLMTWARSVSGMGKRSGGTEFSSQAALQSYLRQHPKADASKHTVAQSTREAAKSETQSSSQSADVTPRKVAGKTPFSDKNPIVFNRPTRLNEIYSRTSDGVQAFAKQAMSSGWETPQRAHEVVSSFLRDLGVRRGQVEAFDRSSPYPDKMHHHIEKTMGALKEYDNLVLKRAPQSQLKMAAEKIKKAGEDMKAVSKELGDHLKKSR